MTTRTVTLDSYTDVTVKLDIKNCPVCGIVYGVPKSMMDRKLRDGGSWYCPNGDNIIFTKTEADKQRERAEQAEKDRDYWQREERRERERAERIKREKAAVKGQLTKTKKRVGKGVCPCCNRHFVNVQKHMESQHPEFAESQ